VLFRSDKVGTGAGIDVELLRKIVGLSSHNILAGGGIRDMSDINALKEIGAGGALVATAVHNGRIPVEFIR
jgi:phosphoribosylformimino-5-aminoimidazole carboxamide ribotide isomerase